MGLNDSFSTARGQILMMNPLPSITQAFSLIKQEERQRNGQIISSSFLANVKPGATENSTGKALHLDGGQVKKPTLKCSYCHKEGHLKESCYKLIGYPPKGRGRGRFHTNSQGFRPYPQAMKVTGTSTSPIGKEPIHNANEQFGASQNSQNCTLESLHKQISQIQQLMSNMMSNNSLSTPEDHVNCIEGPEQAERSGRWC
ncbi:uncharacterized protein LOC141705983 [Apium graveolens]|uniref:uncharacterized protein LOC141705983 n=1 Tax=Apium graveolens TaxID=4045 RepID=UPI003D78EA99